VGRLFLLSDRESVSSCNLVWLILVFLWCTRGKGCHFDLVLKSGGSITFDSRSGVRSLAQVLVLGFLWFLSVDQRSRGGWSGLIFSDRSFSVVTQLSCWGRGVYFWGVFLREWVVTRGGAGFRFYSGHFREGVYFRWWRVFWWVCPHGCFLGCLFSGVPPIYDAFTLYSHFHRSLFVLSRDLVVK